MFKSFSAMQVALGISVAVHAALLTVRLVDPAGFNRMFEDTPLEVILVNASSSDAPLKAQAIAQRNLAGGGEMETGRATSPLPSSAQIQLGDSAVDTY
jgi:periplasmic protein TonB